MILVECFEDDDEHSVPLETAERLSASQDVLRSAELDGQGTGILSLDLCAVCEGRYLTYPGWTRSRHSRHISEEASTPSFVIARVAYCLGLRTFWLWLSCLISVKLIEVVRYKVDKFAASPRLHSAWKEISFSFLHLKNSTDVMTNWSIHSVKAVLYHSASRLSVRCSWRGLQGEVNLQHQPSLEGNEISVIEFLLSHSVQTACVANTSSYSVCTEGHLLGWWSIVGANQLLTSI